MGRGRRYTNTSMESTRAASRPSWPCTPDCTPGCRVSEHARFGESSQASGLARYLSAIRVYSSPFRICQVPGPGYIITLGNKGSGALWEKCTRLFRALPHSEVPVNDALFQKIRDFRKQNTPVYFSVTHKGNPTFREFLRIPGKSIHDPR